MYVEPPGDKGEGQEREGDQGEGWGWGKRAVHSICSRL